VNEEYMEIEELGQNINRLLGVNLFCKLLIFFADFLQIRTLN